MRQNHDFGLQRCYWLKTTRSVFPAAGIPGGNYQRKIGVEFAFAAKTAVQTGLNFLDCR
jgi:hypothetical protein